MNLFSSQGRFHAPHLLSLCFAALLAPLGAFSVQAVQPFVKTVTGLSTDTVPADINIQQGVVDPATGRLFVAGNYFGSAHFTAGIDLPAPDTKLRHDLFLAAQDSNGAWLWAMRPYVANIFAATAITDIDVKDIKVSGTNVFLAGTARAASNGNNLGFVTKLTTDGARVWTRYMVGQDVTANAVAVDGNGTVYVGGSYTTFINSTTTLLLSVDSETAVLTPSGIKQIGAAAQGNYDAYIFKFGSDGSLASTKSWLLAGSPAGTAEETVALQCDGANQLHVLMNLGGGLGNTGQNQTPVTVLNFDGTVYQTFRTTPNSTRNYYLGQLSPFAGSVSPSGLWIAGNPIDTSVDLAGLTTPVINPLSPSFPTDNVRGTDLKLINGEVYVAGYQIYGATYTGFLLRLLADNYAPDGPAAYFVAGGSQSAVYPTEIRGSDDGVFVVGVRPKTLYVDVQDHTVASLPSTPTKTLTALTAGWFIGAFDAALNPQWLRTTSLPNDDLPPKSFSAGMLAFDSANQRLYWGGGFGGGLPLVLGDAPNLLSTTVDLSSRNPPRSWGWLTALQPSGSYLQRSELTVDSTYGPITINGTAFPTNHLDQVFFQGTTLNISVSDQLLNNNKTRLTVTGYTVANQIGTSAGNSLTLKLLDDTSVQFTYQTQHLLTITSDHAAAGLLSDASAGNPDPLFGQTWVPDGTTVKATIDGLATPVDQTQWGDRYVVQTYTITPPTGSPTTSVITQVVSRLKVVDFTMTGPTAVNYSWKKQHRLQVNASVDNSAAFLLNRQLNGATVVSSATGNGDVWFDDKSKVDISALASDASTGLALKGWRYADPVTNYFPKIQFAVSDPTKSDGTELAQYLTSETINGKQYWSKTIPSFTSAAAILWDYGDLIYTLHTGIGQAVDLSSIPTPPSISGQWVSAQVVDGPPGSTIDNMLVWDAVSKKAFPLRPGIILLQWPTGTGAKVTTQIFTGFSGDPWQDDSTQSFSGPAYYNHIAGTPPVNLDSDSTDSRYFDGTRQFTTGDGRAANGQFTASARGKSVLVFYRSPSGPAVGDATRETIEVRVVKTTLWTDATLAKQAATIGTKLISPDGASDPIGTGYVVQSGANYNADIYNPASVKGPIIPVNKLDSSGNSPSSSDLIVVWYQQVDGILWPYKPVWYGTFNWPTGNRIVIASRLGSEGLNASGQPQFSFDPALYTQVKIYNQPDRTKPGFNPNEEHARIYPSLLANSSGTPFPAAFALRDDLNITTALIKAKKLNSAEYTSDPYVLVQYFDQAANEFKMAVYALQREDLAVNDPRVAQLPGAVGANYQFRYQITAGELIQAPYPINLVAGLAPCTNSVPASATPTLLPDGTYFLDDNAQQRTWFIDHKNGAWVVSGDSGFTARFFYPLQPDFWYPSKQDAPLSLKSVGDCIPLLPALNYASVPQSLGVFDANLIVRSTPVNIHYDTAWPTNLPVLKVGETLTYAGGEFKADNPSAPGLPGVIGFAAGQVVFDSQNPAMAAGQFASSFAARLISPLDTRALACSVASLPANLASPASKDVTVNGDSWSFNNLPPSLQKRIFFKPLDKLNTAAPPGVLGLRGYVNDRTLGAPDLTAAPPPVYLLEPNILTATERDALKAAASSTDPNFQAWSKLIDALYTLSRNPNLLTVVGNWLVGLEPSAAGLGQPEPLTGLGPGLALVTNPALLDPARPQTNSYVTIAENNHPSLGEAPVALHVIKIDPTQRYRGATKTILPPNVFDEKITLRHTADFGGNVDLVAFSWWSHEEDGTVQMGDVPPGPTGNSPAWSPFTDANGVAGLNQIELNGNPALLLADNLFFVRYRFAATPLPPQPGWSDWAGAANSSIQDLNGDGRPDYQAQLAPGWVKRVLDGINPYEARVKDFGKSDSPSTAASIIQQLGEPFLGPVALNATPSVVQNLGLIELYETVLQRARALSVDSSAVTVTPGINAALLLASTRLADFYTILAREAWTDALDPTIGYGKSDIDNGIVESPMFSFENQLPTLLDEELALLRGVDQSLGRPVFNRLFWNFTKSEGEAAYALNYQITDVNKDGLIDVNDARTLFPMGHGDAWGHYLSAMRKRYDLLTTPSFVWAARGEYYNLLDVVISVDYNDEKNFARTAAARAQVGAQIVNLTFRSRYSTQPNSNFSGYTDSDTDRAWGVTEWARRAGQASFFDWVTANALLPAADPDTNHVGTQRLDRFAVPEIAQIANEMGNIQRTLDTANSGLNAIGVDPNVVPFDIDPTLLDVGSSVQGLSHFEQIYQRAFEALQNAGAAFDNANHQKILDRQVAASAEQLSKQAVAQDLEYRNRLIEIFGTPYQGTIGAGKAYPDGYAGPDLNLFMYVDVNAINSNTVPVADNQAYFDEYVSFYELAQDVPDEFKADIEAHFFPGISNADALAGNTSVELLGDDLIHLKLPASAGDYTFAAPDSWGQRASPGKLQIMVSAMMQTEAALSLSVGDYDYLIKQIRDKVEVLKAKASIDADQLQLKRDDFIAATTLKSVVAGLEISKTIADQFAEEWHYTAFGLANGLPTVIGTSSDPSFAARQIIYAAGNTASKVSEGLGTASESLAKATELSLEASQGAHELQFTRDEMSLDLVDMLKDIEELLVNEGTQRIAIFKIREQLRGQIDQYRATLQEGLRIIQERSNANARLAADTQNNRYHDLLFRSAQNQSLQRYRVLYDLAQRYCFLAAKAYDYETNFDPMDRASAQPILNQIIREETLGEVSGQAAAAGPGLAGIMAQLHGNFRAVEGRLGFNNPQRDVTQFSLRYEQARINDDAAWANKLTAAKVEDLWTLPEFSLYCRPFIKRGQAEPSLVIRFATQVKAGQNFFGNDLGPGDSAYDPTHFATKIRAAGIRFVNYPLTNLARTPYVYLIPAGMDTMTIPNSSTLGTRDWNVVDQAIPVPNPTQASDLSNPDWLAALGSLSGAFGEARRFSSFRAAVLDGDPALNATRFIGRSVWNSRWLLIIPGRSLSSDPQAGVDQFATSVSDIKLTFETYGYSGN